MSEDRRRVGARGEYLGIQALRAIAAFVVVFGHSMNFLQRGNVALPALILGFQGAVGVDLFFVISGFVMTISTDRLLKEERPVQIFLWRRFLRIAPLYWLLTVIRLAGLALFPQIGVQRRPLFWNSVASFLFLPSMNRLGEIRPVITLGWTLNFEMVFYLLFACALVLRQRFLLLLLPLIVALGALGFARTEAWPTLTAAADPIVLEFAAGVLIAAGVRRGWYPRGLLAGLCLCLGSAGLIWIRADFPLAERPVFWGIPAALVVLGAVGLESVVHRCLPRWVLLLGSASYSIYLIQVFVFPVVDAAAEWLQRAAGWITPFALGEAVVLASLITTAAAGLATHLLVEQPMTDWFKRRLGAKRTAPIVREGEA